MPFFLKSDWEWLKKHGIMDEKGWKCKKTGVAIMSAIIGRSIWMRPFMGGSGEVRQVAHLYCLGCGKRPVIEHGTPIYEDELIEMSRG